MRYRQIFDEVSTMEWSIAGGVFLVLLVLLLFAVVHYRAGRGHEASKTLKHSRAELSWAVALFLFAIFYFVFTISKNTAERSPIGNGKPSVRVMVTGFQWCWRFSYMGTPVKVTGSCIHTYPTLVLPTHEVIRINVTSIDVVHNFWLPYMDFKIAAYPGHVNSFETEFTSDGKHLGRCAEFCGLYHYRMDFYVRTVSPTSFNRWLSSKETSSTTLARTLTGPKLTGPKLTGSTSTEPVPAPPGSDHPSVAGALPTGEGSKP